MIGGIGTRETDSGRWNVIIGDRPPVVVAEYATRDEARAHVSRLYQPRPDGLETVFDCRGRIINPGDRVLDTNGAECGTVETITDLDGDVNDYGRPVAIYPRVIVRYDDGVTDSFTSWWLAYGYGDDAAPYMCDDVEVAA